VLKVADAILLSNCINYRIGSNTGIEIHQGESLRQRMVEIAMLLEEKTTIPAVKTQLGYLASMQENEFWEGMNLNGLEELRQRLRGLMSFLDKKKRKIVYTDFEDEVLNVRQEELVDMPKM
jgi:type I restriction enzyme R subunit